MATVHRAIQTLRNGTVREVALKRLLPTLKRELVTLFLDEARLLRHLDHPNIATTFDSGRVFGTYFISMEYVRGPTLKQLVEQARTVGAVPQAVTLNLAMQLCDALDHAHNRCDEHGAPLGIIHRDVTPANILLADNGLLKVIDFGLAKATSQTEESVAGIIKGKFGYIAPEYLGGKLDRRVDLWAVGIIMYELLTSRRLFDGVDDLDTMRRVAQMPIPRPSIANPTVPPELDALVMRALDRDPETRWQTAAEMREGIEAVIAQAKDRADHHQVAQWVEWVFGAQDQPAPSFTRTRAPTVVPVDSRRAIALPKLPIAPSSPVAIWLIAGAALLTVVVVLLVLVT